MAQAIQILLNEAMKLEREEFLGAGLHERTPDRRGHANGYKPKRLKSRLGELGVASTIRRALVRIEVLMKRVMSAFLSVFHD